jgi:zinc transporter
LRWLQDIAKLPATLHALMLVRDGQQHFVAERGGIALIVHDFERGFDPASIGRIGTLHLALTDGLLVTGRYRPLHSADLLRERLEQGAAVTDAPSALGFLLGTLVDSLAALVLDLNSQLLEAEADLVADDIAPDTRELVGARRRSAQLHRMIGGLRATLQRMERDPGLPPSLAPVPHALQPRLAGLDGDIVSAQQQLRLLRDELDLQAAQRTNQNVYLLSILTALMMPATLVTGFFGMNTGGLPFAEGRHCTLLATAVAALSAAGSYWLLRLMGLVRRQ